MADRYISEKALIENIAKIEDLRTLSTKTVGIAISATPTADVVEVRHGHWIRINNKRACSECGYYYFSNGVDANYCSECGAKMDRGNLSAIPTGCERRDT